MLNDYKYFVLCVDIDIDKFVFTTRRVVGTAPKTLQNITILWIIEKKKHSNPGPPARDENEQIIITCVPTEVSRII